MPLTALLTARGTLSGQVPKLEATLTGSGTLTATATAGSLSAQLSASGTLTGELRRRRFSSELISLVVAIPVGPLDTLVKSIYG